MKVHFVWNAHCGPHRVFGWIVNYRWLVGLKIKNTDAH